MLTKRFRLFWQKIVRQARHGLLIAEGSEPRQYFLENIGMLLDSGLDLSMALLSMEAEVPSRRFRAVVRDTRQDVEGGAALWEALSKHAIFPSYVIALLRVGEQTGQLSQTIHVIVEEQHKQAILRARVRSILAYPCIVITFAIIIGTGVAWVVLPRLATVFSELRVDLPLITRAMIATGKFLAVYGNKVVPAFFVVLVIIMYVLFFNSKTKGAGQRLLLAIPGIKKLIREIELARIGYMLGTLLVAGLPLIPALNSLVEVVAFKPFKRTLVALKDYLEEGYSFAAAFAKLPNRGWLFPLPVEHMITVADQSGRLPQIFLKIGELFEQQAETTSKNLTVLLEPVLLVLIWVGVGVIALSVIVPIYSLLGGVKY